MSKVLDVVKYHAGSSQKYVVEITPAGCGEMFSEYGKHTTNDRILIDSPEKVALVVFTGGSDVSPELYGENVGRFTWCSSHRDIYESKMFEIAEKNKIPCVGICRGSQFLCVKSGGKLVQDITGHSGRHGLRTNEDKTLICNSTHHQMQLPGKDAVVLAWAEPRLSKRYLNGDNEDIVVERENEVVYYPNIKSLGLQGHPEWLSSKDEFVQYSLEVVRKYLF
jgi:GMP synthase-like glutamine amidotransferase